jgi:chromosomal replication initiator protein
VISGIFSIPLAASLQSEIDAALTPAGAAPSIRKKGSTAAESHEPPVFVAGPENSLVRVLIEAVQTEAVAYNPIVLVGGTGLGKTSLLHALTQVREQAWPAVQGVSITAADFARSYVHAYETKSVSDFRGRHQRAGILVIDDLHTLANKPAAQQELISTLDALIRRGSLVLVSMRRQPAEVRGLLPGLVSRLSAGLIVPLSLPEAAARRAMIEQLSRQLEIPLPREVVQRLADSPKGKRPAFATPVQLRHAVLQLAHLAQVNASNIDVQLVEQLVKQHQPETKGTLRQVTTAVAKHFQLTGHDLKGESRQQTVVRARSLAMYLCRELTPASYADIGKFFGGRDHTTVLHACRKISGQLSADNALRELAEDLATQLALAGERN